MSPVYSVTYVPSSYPSTASTALQFLGIGSGNTFWLLDDVSVTRTTVPDGGSTVSLLGFGLLGLAALRRRLGC